MSRFLFVVPPLTGHTNPTVSVASELISRGHEVAWVGHPGQIRSLLPNGAHLIALDDSVPEALVADMTERARQVRGLAALKFLWQDFFIPLARAMLPGVEQAFREFGPDLVIVDQQALAGGIAARRAGLPWVTLATTSAGVTNPLSALPKVKEWLDQCFAELQAEAGLSVLPSLDCSPHGVIIFSTEALVGPTEQYPDHFHFVGPSLHERVDSTPFPFEALRDGPKVLVSLGTVNSDRGARFYSTAMDALSSLDAQVIMVAPESMAPDPPANFIVRSRVPQLDLLPHMSAVVCHAGHNTVCESLAHGLPLIVAPIKDDQPVVAQQVAASGAGIRLRFGRLRAAELRQSVEALLTEPGYRAAAQTIQESFKRAGKETVAVDVMETLI